MAPTTRSSAKKSARTDENDIAAHTVEKDIVSWTSDVSGEVLYYERLYILEEEAEVLFVQLRMTEDGELVPYTKDSEDEDEGTAISDGSHSEKGEADTDFVPEVKRARRRQTKKANKANKNTSLPAVSSHAPSYPTNSLPALLISATATPVLQPVLQPVHPSVLQPVSQHVTQPVAQPVTQPVLQPSLLVRSLPAALPLNLIEEMADLMEGESVLDFAVRPLSEAVLQTTSQRSLRSLLRNVRVADLAEVNGAEAHAIEKEAYDTVRPGKFVNGRWVLDPRSTIFRPTNPDYKTLAEMGP